jgi:hypothetical protein
MRTSICVAVLLALFAVTNDSAQSPQLPGDVDDRAAEKRVEETSRRLKYDDRDPADTERYYAELDTNTQELRNQIDQFVGHLPATQSTAQLQTRLRTVLASHATDSDSGDLPFARLLDVRFGRSLVIAYMLVRPPHHNIGTIRGYRIRSGRFELADTTGADFERYGMFERELRSPVDGEFWMLVWGQEHTFNGRLIRFRVYSFDGLRFKTIWAPEDIVSADVHLSNDGFVIDHDVRYPPYGIHDEYAVTANGVVKTK